MMRNTPEWLAIKQGIRTRYAWPGGYPLFVCMSDGAALCIDCARHEFRRLALAHHQQLDNGWQPIGVEVNYEDEDCACAHCLKVITPAYTQEDA